ncbi:MAG: hypothetical protein D6B26_06345 [Spirochaetaceae bacterium]|nr:MAG: hypothetical protein D6B26_06345 [Spirochaetaceae bacterium]
MVSATPLLPGSTRERLLTEGKVRMATITLQNMQEYDQVCLFNAMLPLGECCLPVSSIKKK